MKYKVFAGRTKSVVAGVDSIVQSVLSKLQVIHICAFVPLPYPCFPDSGANLRHGRQLIPVNWYLSVPSVMRGEGVIGAGYRPHCFRESSMVK